MIYILIFAVIVCLLCFFIFYPNRKAAYKIGKEINIKPYYIEKMLMSMGKQKGPNFVSFINKGGIEVLELGVKTFFIYRILISSTRQNVEWWGKQLNDNGYSTDLSYAEVDFALSFLADAVTEDTNAREFYNDYQRNFM